MVTHTKPKHPKHAKKEHKAKPKSLPCIGCVLELPPELTRVGLTGDQKAIAILLIIENIKPYDKKRYNSADAEESMRLMRQVLINRLKSKTPGRYGAVGAKTTTDIIRGKKQFEGLGNYPKTTNRTVYDAFNEVIKSKDPPVKNYVNMAIKIATLDENSIRATIPNVAGWMTINSNPGGSFVKIKTLAGNDFFIDDPTKDPKPSENKKITPHAKKHSSNTKNKSTRKRKK